MMLPRIAAALLATTLLGGQPALAAAGLGQVGGFNEGLPVTPTVQNAAYSAGNSLGGLQTITFFRTPNFPTDIFDNFWIASQGGSTVAMTVYVFDAQPSANACLDKTALALTTADLQKLAMAPFVLTPVVIGSGSTVTFAQLTQTVSIKNHDSPLSRNLYLCLVANGSVTPASTTDLLGKISGALD